MWECERTKTHLLFMILNKKIRYFSLFSAIVFVTLIVLDYLSGPSIPHIRSHQYNRLKTTSLSVDNTPFEVTVSSVYDNTTDTGDLQREQYEVTLPFKSWTRGLTTNLSKHSTNCNKLFAGHRAKDDKVRKHNQTLQRLKFFPPFDLLQNTYSCQWLEDQFLDNFYVSDEELEFPLAFSFNVYNSPLQIVRLIKAIYRPQNVYCIHYDGKSANNFQQIFINLAKCLPNVFVPDKIEMVYRGWHSLVDAQVNCFEKLLTVHNTYPWQYLTTLCGKELPLRTNGEMVEIYKELNGTSAVGSIGLPAFEKFYFDYKWEINTTAQEAVPTSVKNEPIPFNITLYKSSAYFGLSVKFVRFLLVDEKVSILRKFMESTKIPEEHFVATVFKMPGAIGGYNKEYAKKIPTVASAIWLSGEKWREQCNGLNVHEICICSSDDLHRLDYRPHTLGTTGNWPETLFQNKYYIEFDQIVMECMEEELVRRNKEEYRKDHLFASPN